MGILESVRGSVVLRIGLFSLIWRSKIEKVINNNSFVKIQKKIITNQRNIDIKNNSNHKIYPGHGTSEPVRIGSTCRWQI